jgi:hypothetical protein
MATTLSSAATLQCAHRFAITPTTAPALTISGSPVAVSGSLSVTCTITDGSPPPPKHCTTISAAGGVAAALTAGGTAVLLDSVTLTSDGAPPTCTVTAETPAPLTAA